MRVDLRTICVMTAGRLGVVLSFLPGGANSPAGRMMTALRSVDRTTAVAFGLFAILTIALAAHHEPWRDETDAWLMARDARVAELFHYAGYSGTPALWYLIQAPFAKAGASYATQRYLHLVIALTAAGLGTGLRLLFLVRVRGGRA